MTERVAKSLPGLQILAAGIVAVLAGVVLIVVGAHLGGGASKILITLAVVIFVADAFLLRGLTPVVPGKARVVQLFGKYRGTIRTPGLQWVNPFTRRIRCPPGSATSRPAQAKVNDADGNPIEIAAVVVWQVQRHGPGDLRRRRLHAVRQHPDRDRGTAHRVQLPL